MKTTFAFALLVVVGIGLNAPSTTIAQQPPPLSNPAYPVPAAQQNPEVLLPGMVDNNAGIATPPYNPANGPAVGQQNPEILPPGPANGNAGAAYRGGPGMAQPTATVRPLSDDELLIDNGLWEGADVGIGCATCGGGSNAPPADWYTEQDVRILTRSRSEFRRIGYSFPATTIDGTTSRHSGNEVLSSYSTAPNISGVWGMTLGHYFARDTANRDHFIEFTFWGLNNWQDEASANGTRVNVLNQQGQRVSQHGSLFSQYGVRDVTTALNTTIPYLNGTVMHGFDEVDRQTTSYTSSTNNFEINGRFTPRGREDRIVLHPNGKWRRECQPGTYMSYLYGVRFFQLNETYRFHGEGRTDTFDPNSGALIDSQTYTGDYDVVAHNNLLGLQVGLDMSFRKCRWAWGMYGKVGPYVNFSDQVSSISAGPEFSQDFVRRLAWSKHGNSIIGEAGLEASYKFRPNLVGRVSYDFMWVSGVALAPDQLQFTTTPSNKIDADGFLFVHGAKFGLEWLW